MVCSTTKNFFSNPKKDWSRVKDELLQCYLRPYANKLFHTKRPLIYIDCFAGAGTYGGRTDLPDLDVKASEIPDCFGSPYIALKELTRASEESTLHCLPEWHSYFIEKKYFNQLLASLSSSQFPKQYFTCIDGDFKDVMPRILDEITGKAMGRTISLFCYIDPFGIRDLKMSVLQKTIDLNIKSTELLINFNSFGLLRAAKTCLLHDSIEDEIRKATDELDYDAIFEQIYSLTPTAKKQFFTDIFGCDEWMQIIDGNIQDLYDGYEAEELLSNLFKSQLKKILGFNFILDIPIRLDDGKHPKYRMVHATNHYEGAALMGNTIRKRKDNLYTKWQGQGSLFDLVDYEDSEPIKNNILKILTSREMRLTVLEANYYNAFGIPATPISDLVNEMEKDNRLIVRRDPEFTHGRKTPSSFKTERENHRLYISKLE